MPRRRLDPFRRQEGLSLPFGLLLSSLLPQPGFDRERPQLMTFDLDILCDAPWRMNDFRRIEDGRAPGDGGQCCRRSHRVGGVSLQMEPMGIALRGEGLPDTRRAIAQPNIAVTSAGIAELGKAPVLVGHDKIRREATH